MLPSRDNDELRTRFYVILAIGFVLLLLAVVGTMDAEDEQFEQKLYCDMVDKHRADPSTGWPDYQGVYNEFCR